MKFHPIDFSGKAHLAERIATNLLTDLVIFAKSMAVPLVAPMVVDDGFFAPNSRRSLVARLDSANIGRQVGCCC
jgi:hypothetical protein